MKSERNVVGRCGPFGSKGIHRLCSLNSDLVVIYASHVSTFSGVLRGPVPGGNRILGGVSGF